MISLRAVGRNFQSQEILREVDLEVAQGEFVAIVGRSGSGKSTLLSIIGGLDMGYTGSVRVAGQELRDFSDSTLSAYRNRQVGFVFQSLHLLDHLSCVENVALASWFAPTQSGKGVPKVRARELLAEVGLADKVDVTPPRLSGGEKQRVAIARALANRPKVLLMDEPFGALDAQTRAKMQAYLLEIWKNIDVTVFFITHDLDEAVYLADRILVLKANPGEVQEIVEVPVPQPRSPDQFMDPEFLATKQHIEELIHPPAEQEEDDDHLNLVRMVHVNDDVGSVF